MDWVKKNYEAVTIVVGEHAFMSDRRGLRNFFVLHDENKRSLFDLARLTATKKYSRYFLKEYLTRR